MLLLLIALVVGGMGAAAQPALAGREAGIRASGAAPNGAGSSLEGNPQAIRAGKEIFLVHCGECHAAEATGRWGPNLTDNEWRNNGSSYQSVLSIIAEGVKGKPMPAWKKRLVPLQIREVAALVYNFRNCPTEMWKSCLDGP